MKSIYKLIGRETGLFGVDIATWESILKETIARSRVHRPDGDQRDFQAESSGDTCVMDLSENNLVELVRDDVRDTLGYIDGDFQKLPLS